MILGFYYKSALLLFYFAQGLLFSLILLKKGLSNSEKSSLWLSLLIFLSCLYITPWMLGHAGWYGMDGYREFLFFMPFQQFFLIGPALYFYINSLLNPSYKLKKTDWMHFIPAILYALYSLTIVIVDTVVLDEFYFYADGKDKDLAPWYQISGIGFIISYVIVSIRNYNRYRLRIFDVLSFADSVVFNWVRKFLISLLLILIIRIVFLIVFPNWGEFGMKWWYYFFFACTFYYIAFAGYTNAIISSVSIQLSKINTQRLGTEVKEESFESTSLSESFLQEWKKKINHFVLLPGGFKNPTLTLMDIAIELDTTTKQISAVINQGYQLNFNDFINSYRVEEVKNRIRSNHHLKVTLLSIALDSGFNSKTTFNRAFKKHTNLTPNQFIAQLEYQSSGAKS